MLPQLLGDSLKITHVRIPVTTAIVSDASLVMNTIPHHTVVLPPGHRPAYGEGESPLEGCDQQSQHLVTLNIIRKSSGPGEAAGMIWLTRTGVTVILDSIIHDILDHDHAAVRVAGQRETLSAPHHVTRAGHVPSLDSLHLLTVWTLDIGLTGLMLHQLHQTIKVEVVTTLIQTHHII